MTKLYVYVTTLQGVDRIVMTFDVNGLHVPMIYMTLKEAESSEVSGILKKIVNEHNVYIELREYDLVNTVCQYVPNNTIFQ